ncbi:dipeptide/oligopeptide/nickel ABC transporter permease/ATP-binding protein [Actinoallomurus sp. CA-142502]|uniref:dipeptide/oligopeptide/nickel ABC transporter permease/ATP-binding protein n=1 Tax=Actinoallomurus sp. CA-142502 TaxID=3239885 RepID=UPI003D944D28
MTTLPEPAPRPAANAANTGLVRSVLRSPRGAIVVAFLVVLILACALASLIAPYDPLAQHLSAVRSGPSGGYWLGTDSLGRDLLSRLLHGGRSSLLGVLEAVVTLLIVALPTGLLAGYLGGTFDRIAMRVAEVVMSVPVVIILLAVLSIFNHSMTSAMIAFGVLGSSGLMRVIRGAALTAREELYVTAAELMGLSRLQVVVRHVLPRCRGAIIIQASLFAAVTLGVQTGLTFLSLGPPPPAATWGGMVADAASVFNQDAWMLVPPGATIALTVLAFGLLGDVVRDVSAEKYAAAPASRRKRRTGTPETAGRPEPATDMLLSVRDLSVATDGERPLTLLDAVGFDIAAGETVGLVGESGSGKTMTARAVIGLLPGNCQITSGRVVFDGSPVQDLDQRAFRKLRGRRIAMISQEPMAALDPSFRIGSLVAEVVRAVDGIKGKAAHARAIELLRMVEIPDPEAVARRFPHQISGGMAQRVAIAMAIAGRPELLIADEPTTALDVTVQAEILDLLRSLQQQNNMAILLVTHDWGVVADVCTKVVVMYAGQVVETAPAGEVFDRPAHPYTRALLLSSPENTHVGERIQAIPGSVPTPQRWPAGCRFASRCDLAQPGCTEGAIPVKDISEGRLSRCLRVDTLLGGEARR